MSFKLQKSNIEYVPIVITKKRDDRVYAAKRIKHGLGFILYDPECDVRGMIDMDEQRDHFFVKVIAYMNNNHSYPPAKGRNKLYGLEKTDKYKILKVIQGISQKFIMNGKVYNMKDLNDYNLFHYNLTIETALNKV